MDSIIGMFMQKQKNGTPMLNQHKQAGHVHHVHVHRLFIYTVFPAFASSLVLDDVSNLLDAGSLAAVA